MKPISAVVVIAASILAGCAKQDSLEASIRTQAEMKAKIEEIQTKQDDYDDRFNKFLRTQVTVYTLTDVADSKRKIGSLVTGRTIGVGERIFLAEDMYDVKHVKNFTSAGSPTDFGASYTLYSVELLVTFEGKGKTIE